MMTRPLYQTLASTVEAAFNCEKQGNLEWFGRHELRLELLVKEYMPSGGGFDAGTTLPLHDQRTGVLRFRTSFHHMDPEGYYREWTSHEVIVAAHLAHGISITVTGRNVNGIKEYIGEVFHQALMQPIASDALAMA